MTIPGMEWGDVLGYRRPKGKDFFVAEGRIETLETRPAYGEAALIVSPATGWGFWFDEKAGWYRPVKGFMAQRLTGVEMIRLERERQISSAWWTPQHDDNHRVGELWRAARCYLYSSWDRSRRDHDTPPEWPWDTTWWKPGPHIENLVKAGALIAAEIDRLQRLEHQGR